MIAGVIGIFSTGSEQAALAADPDTTATLSVAKKNDSDPYAVVAAGKQFELVFTITTTHNDVWYSGDINFGPLDNSGAYDEALSQKMSVGAMENAGWVEDGDIVLAEPFRTQGGYLAADSCFNFNQSSQMPQGAANLGLVYNTQKAHGNPQISTATPYVVTVKITLASDILDSMTADSNGDYLITFGTSSESRVTAMSYGNDGSVYDRLKPTGSDGLFATVPVTIKVREASTDATLKTLTVGHAAETDDTKLGKWEGTDSAPIPVYDDASGETILEFTSNTDTINDFFTQAIPTDENVAKIEVAFKMYDGGGSPQYTYEDVNAFGAAGDTKEKYKLADLTLHGDGSDSEVRIKVTAEDETTVLEYRVKVKIGYVRLSALTVTSYSTTDGVTIKDFGFDTNGTTPIVFDPETEEYNIYVPKDSLYKNPDDGTALANDALYIDVAGTVLGGYGSSAFVKLTTEQCSVVDSTGTAIPATGIASAGVIKVSDIKEGSTLTLTVTAQDATTTKDYKLKLIPLSVDTTIDPFQVEGPSGTKYDPEALNSNLIPSDYVKPTAPDGTVLPFFYFILMNESTFTGAMKITLKDPGSATAGGGAKITVAWSDGTQSNSETYDATKQYALGDYQVTVTAEAGNQSTYKVTLAMPLALKLIDGSSYTFIYEFTHSSGDIYRADYYDPDPVDHSLPAMTHGVDDQDFDRFVIGQVPTNTQAKDFLLQIFEPHRNLIKIYYPDSAGDILLYDCGEWTADGSGDTTASQEMLIGTGSYIKFGAKDAAEPIETVYISVLSDITGDGELASVDISRAYSYLAGGTTDVPVLANVEYRLALRVRNSGVISTIDVSAMYSLFSGEVSLDNYYTYKPAPATPAVANSGSSATPASSGGGTGAASAAAYEPVNSAMNREACVTLSARQTEGSVQAVREATTAECETAVLRKAGSEAQISPVREKTLSSVSFRPLPAMISKYDIWISKE